MKFRIFTAVLGLLFWALPSGFCQETPSNRFLVLTIDNKIINPVIAGYVADGIEKAQSGNYNGVIILMDTPGGLLESTRAIVKKIMNSSVPVIVYIAPSGSRAGSAGVFITLAAHVAAMAPSTNIGAAHPVELGAPDKSERSLKRSIEELTEALRSEGNRRTKKEETKPRTGAPQTSGSALEDKVVNDTVAWAMTIAKSRNRNAEWARAAVLENTSATEKEALEKKVINLVADDMAHLLKTIDGLPIALPKGTTVLNTKNARLDYTDLTLRQNILNTIVNPNIAYILLLVGFLSLFVEITHPGVVFPGIVGVICLILAFYAFAMLPVNYAGFVMIALGIILFVAEALTPATFGLLTLGGAVCMMLGSLMLIDTPFAAMRISLSVILPFVLAMATVVIFLVSRVMKAHRKKVATGAEALIGQTGTAQTDIDEEGQVFLGGEIWTAVNKGSDPVKKGEKIKVLGVDKVKLLVSKYEA